MLESAKDSHIIRFNDENESIPYILSTLGSAKSISSFANNRVTLALRDFISELLKLEFQDLIDIKNNISRNNEHFNEYSKIMKLIRQSKAANGNSFQNLIIAVINYNKNGVSLPHLIISLDTDYYFTIEEINQLLDKLAQLNDSTVTLESIYSIADSVRDEH